MLSPKGRMRHGGDGSGKGLPAVALALAVAAIASTVIIAACINVLIARCSRLSANKWHLLGLERVRVVFWEENIKKRGLQQGYIFAAPFSRADANHVAFVACETSPSLLTCRYG